MNVADALAARYACRAYRPDPVSREDVLALLAAATRAPSWANTQPWEIFVAAGEPLERLRRGFIERLERGMEGAPDLPRPASWPEALRLRTQELLESRARLLGFAPDDPAARRAHLLNNHRLFGAPAVIYLCMERGLTAWSAFDLGALEQSIMLAARERGLDTAPAVMLAIHPDLVRRELGIPDALAVVIGIALGRADAHDPQNAFRSTRRPLGEVVRLVGF
jgi:nitroreductase